MPTIILPVVNTESIGWRFNVPTDAEARVLVLASVTTTSTLGDGVQLVGDEIIPGPLKAYSTDTGGNKGWFSVAASGVTSLHVQSNPDLAGDVTLIQGANVTLTQSGQTITIAASSAVTSAVTALQVQGQPALQGDVTFIQGVGIVLTQSGQNITIAKTGTGTIWFADGAPQSAGALDDEFTTQGAGVPSGWTEVDFNNHQSVAVVATGLELTSTNSANSYENAGIYKSIPAGDFTIWTKVSLVGAALSNYCLGGLALWENATDSTKKLSTWYFYTQGGGGNVHLDLVIYTNFNTSSSTPFTGNIVNTLVPIHVYLRIRRTGTTYQFDYSTDGIGWEQATQQTAAQLGFTPTHFGPMCGVNTSIINHSRFPFFRYVASDVTVFGIAEGNRQ